MKKIILLVGLGLSSLFANQTSNYVDLYGEVQINMIVAEKCLEEVAYTRNLDGKSCAVYATMMKNNIYSNIIKQKFSFFNTQNTMWIEEDWMMLKGQIKKLIYVNDLIIQFKK